MAKKSASRVQLEVKYRELRKKLVGQIEKISKSAYAKDVEKAKKYIEPRIPSVSKIGSKRNLEMAIREAEAALKNKTFVIAERKRARKKAVEMLNETFGTDYFKNYRQASKFYEFMEKVREHSQDIIYDSDKAVDIFLEHSDEKPEKIIERYREFESEFRTRSPKRVSF
jgi:acetyl-CoA carboxylase alpha subunit